MQGPFSAGVAGWEAVEANMAMDRMLPIRADHFNICKPSARTSPAYFFLVEFLKDRMEARQV